MEEDHPKEEELAPLPQAANNKEELKKNAMAGAERARLYGFIQVSYLPAIFAIEERYSAILPRLWNFYECDRVSTIHHWKSEYERWLCILQRWCGMSGGLWKSRSPISHLPVYDSETRKLKKERYGGRSDSDIVMLEDLKKYMENISKNLNIDFPLPSLLFPEAQEEKKELKHSPDFRTINKDGKEFTLTPKQAQVIQILFEAQEQETSGLGKDYILEQVSPYTSTKRLRDLFKANPEAWEALIEPCGKGIFRLKR